MKKISILFLILFNLTFTKSIEIHPNNYHEYAFETKDATYVIMRNGYGNYDLFKSTKATGEISRILIDRKLNLLLGHLVSREAVAVKLYPIKELEEEKNAIKTKDN